MTEEGAHDILENPSRIFNMDETGMSLCPKIGNKKKQIGNNTFAITSKKWKEMEVIKQKITEQRQAEKEEKKSSNWHNEN